MFAKLLTLVLLLSLRAFPVNSTCCFDLHKVCESISDVTTFGSSDWISLDVIPGRCENSSKVGVEILKKTTFEKVPKITNLYIADIVVQFEEECFSPLKDNLVYLGVMKNNMTTVPKNVFQDLSKLKKLVLRDNKISELSDPFKNLPKLDILLLSGNKLTEIKSGTLNTLTTRTIDLSYNQISTIQPNSFPNNLIALYLKRNNLEQIQDNTFSNLQSLEMLLLSKNKLRVIKKGTFAGLSNLRKLDLSKNEISTIEPDTFSDLQELMSLYLENNKLRVFNADIFLKDMINLTNLELDQNQLSYLPENVFERMPNLQEISLSGNPWQCKCLEKIINILSNISLTDELRPRCTGKQQECVHVI